MENTDFWSRFLPVFVSSLISGLIFTVLIGLIVSYIRRPKVKISLSISTSVKGHRLNFFAVNTGKVGLMPNELQWGVFFPQRIEPQKEFVRPDGVMSGMLSIGDGSYNYYSGFNEKPVLAGDSLLLIHILIDVKEYKIDNEKRDLPDVVVEHMTKHYGDFDLIDQAKYYYSLTTKRGMKTYENFFWDYFKKKNKIKDFGFVDRTVFEIKDVEI